MKMKYQIEKYRLVALFSGAHGLFTFDLRRGKQLEYYDMHYYPSNDFDMCNQQLSNHAVTSGTTFHMRYDVRAINLNQPLSAHDDEAVIYPGHHASITKIRTDGEYIVTGAKNGEIRVLNFNVYKQQLNMGPNCITI